MPALSNCQLSKLNFGDTMLLVAVENITVDLQHGYGLCGHKYVQPKPAISGTLEVNSDSNSITDIQTCLGNPFNKRSHLLHAGRWYEILITGVNWGFDQFGDGQFSSYRCKFIANPLNRPVDQEIDQENANKVIWDAGSKDGLSVLDIQELIGVENLDDIAESAVALIDKYTRYEPTVEHPCPSSVDGGSSEDDIAAVLADTKPAAVVNEAELSRKPLVVLLLKEAQARGLRVDTVKNFGTRYSKMRSVVVGEEYNVRQIVEIMSQAVRDDAVSEYYYWRLGKLLGHPDDALNNFVKNIKDFGFNRA